MHFHFGLLFLSLSVIAAHLGHGHHYAHVHNLEHRAVKTEVEVVTITQVLTVTVDAHLAISSALQTNMPAMDSTSSTSLATVLLTTGAVA
jgi:hypothetical protein